MKVHTYIVQHDKGFAPNPFWGVCTLACCKPQIRKHAQKGDVIIGFGSASGETDLRGRVIYWMRVENIISFDEYWRDPQYAVKHPVFGSSLMAWYGDNIYHRDEGSGEWVQAYSFHKDGTNLGSGNLERDTGTTDRVLIGREYTYWGGSAPLFPDSLLDMMPSGRARRCNYTDEEKAKILAWIDSQPERGFIAEPADWHCDHAPKLKDEAGLMGVARYAEHVRETDQFKNCSREERRRISIYGLVSEIGSVISAVKKQKLWEGAHRNIEGSISTGFKLTGSELHEELGDVIWYCFALAMLEGRGDSDILARHLEGLSEHLKGHDRQSALFRESLDSTQIEEFHQSVEAFLRKKQRTFQGFQKIAYLTARTKSDDLVEISLTALMQLGAQLMRLLLPELEKQLHDQVHDRPALNILGKIAWYLSAIATVYGLSLDKIADENIQKAKLRQSTDQPTPLHDEKFHKSEQFPRLFSVQFITVDAGRSRMYWEGRQLGHDLKDNSNEDDGYRFHDALHLANIAHLGWSPVFRGFMGRKRKSAPKIDEVQDGARAVAVEEAILKVIHSEGMEIAEILHPHLAPKDRPMFSNDVDIPSSFFKLIQRYVKGLEVANNSFHEWKAAIRSGFRIYKDLTEHGQGTAIIDLERRKITFHPEVYVDLAGAVVGIGSCAVALPEFNKDAQDKARSSMTEVELSQWRSEGAESVRLAYHFVAKCAILQALGINHQEPEHFNALSLTEIETGKFSVKTESLLQEMMWKQKIIVFKTSFIQNQSSINCTALALSDPPKAKG